MKKILLLVALACATFIVSNVGAQESVAPVSPAAPSEATNREDTPEYRAFADEMVKYKTALKKLRSLKEAYQTASATEKDQIVAEFTPLVEATTQQQKQIVPLRLCGSQSGNLCGTDLPP